MATKKTVRRVAVAKRNKGNDRRGSAAAAPTRAQVSKFTRDYNKSGGQIAFPKGTSAAFRGAVKKSMAAGEGARKANSKGQAAMVAAYSGANDRRGGERRGGAGNRRG